MENQGRSGGEYDLNGWNVGNSIGNSQGGTRWEVDDGPKGFSDDTVHLVWVRMVDGAYTIKPSPLASDRRESKLLKTVV